LEDVPKHGVTVGIDTIARARESIMVVWGVSKSLTLQRMLAAERYDPSWPATVIHECPIREIVADAAAAAIT
jgi:glucosamine-6-phosphate deaminase